MEYDIRTSLMILSAIAIVAILLHGLWKIRKNKNPYRLKAKIASEQVNENDNVERNFDGSGFDQDGVSQPRIIRNESLDDSDEITLKTPVKVNDIDTNLTHSNSRIDSSGFSYNDESDNRSEHDVVEPIDTPVYETPISSPKPTIKVKRKEPVIQKEVKVDPEVLVLSVLMPNNELMSGSILLPTLLTLGMKYGEMNIFHRHEDNAGNGNVTFSLANMMNPGTFDLDSMENFTTQGVSLFMTLPTPTDGFKVFDQMLSAAKKISQEFNAQLLDDKRNIMTKQTEQHYVSRIRDFERKYRIASS